MPCTTAGSFRLGTSGWQYRHWRGVFYPDELPTKDWFSHYSKEFDTVSAPPPPRRA